ncbi:hypothetical protein ABFS83_09G035000 [Erythranthe nasuta]
MDCGVPVDDYCNARQDNNLEIPENIHSTDHFFIVFEVDTTYPNNNNNQEEEEDFEEDEFVRVESKDSFWVRCPRTGHENLSRDTISDMLTQAGVPIHKQDFMVDAISDCADEIANSAFNDGVRVLPMLVSVSTVACFCYYEDEDVNGDQ